MSNAELIAWKFVSECNRDRLQPRDALRRAGLPVVGDPGWAEAVEKVAAHLAKQYRAAA